MLLPLRCILNTNLFLDCVKLVGYLASPINVVSSNPCVGPSPIIKIFLFLLSTCTDELKSIPKVFPKLPPVIKISEREPTPIL